ncbi:hypothetical protein Tco_0430927 [Tanacetum coccineum]
MGVSLPTPSKTTLSSRRFKNEIRTFSSIFATVSTAVVVSRTTSDATSGATSGATYGVVEELDVFFWYTPSVIIGEVGGFRFGVALVVVGSWSAKHASVTRANEKASPKVVGFDLKSAHSTVPICKSLDSTSFASRSLPSDAMNSTPENNNSKNISSIFATVSTAVVVSRTTSDATSGATSSATYGVVEELDVFFWYTLSVIIGEVGGFRFGVALVVVDSWSAKHASVTRANEKASPKVVGFDLKSAHCRAGLSPAI